MSRVCGCGFEVAFCTIRHSRQSIQESDSKSMRREGSSRFEICRYAIILDDDENISAG